MIELHDATGDWKRLQKLVDYWVQPKVVSLIQKHQAYLLVNIGNEVGDDAVKESQFTAGYKNAVKRMREAGIHTPLVIDASDWGKDLDILNATADKLIQADTDKNLIFSVHLYWPISAGADADFIQSKLHAAVAQSYPLIVGEFSKYGGFAGEDEEGKPRSICGEFGEIDYQTILKVCDEKEIGWYAWEWGPGNAVKDPLCAVMDMTPDGQFDHLKPGWATDVADSIKHASENQNYFRLEPVPELSALQTRLDTLKAVLSHQKDQKAVSEALQKTDGDWSKALASLTKNKELPAEALQKLALAHSLAVWSDDQVSVVKALAERTGRHEPARCGPALQCGKTDCAGGPARSAGEHTWGNGGGEEEELCPHLATTSCSPPNPPPCCNGWCRTPKFPIADTNHAHGRGEFSEQPARFQHPHHFGLHRAETSRRVQRYRRRTSCRRRRAFEDATARAGDQPHTRSRTGVDEGEPDLGVSGRRDTGIHLPERSRRRRWARKRPGRSIRMPSTRTSAMSTR